MQYPAQPRFRQPRHQRWTLLACIAALALTSRPSSAETSADAVKLRCAQAYEQVQRLRRSGKLVSALESAVICAQASCPALLHGDCTTWVSELEASIPAVILEASATGGAVLQDVQVYVDDSLLTERLDGHATRLDPGLRKFRFVDRQGRSVELSHLIVEGNRQQRVHAQFPRARTLDQTTAQPSTSQPNVALYAFGALGLVGLGSFAYFGVQGNQRKQSLKDSCEPRCTEDDVRPIRRDYLIADVSLGVGVASLAVFTWLLVKGTSRTTTQTALPLDLKAHASGAQLQYRSAF